MTDQIAECDCTTADSEEKTCERNLFAPDVDIYETNDAVIVLADVPGVAADGLEITLEKNVLVIHAAVKDGGPEGFALEYAEYETGNYRRSFSISDEIDGDRIEADLNEGVLALTLPKASPNQKKISVNVN